MSISKRSLSSLALLVLAGCFRAPDDVNFDPGVEPAPPEAPQPAFLVSELLVPTNDEELAAFGQDFNQDGEIDEDDNALGELARLPNKLKTLANIASFFGFDIEVNIDLDLQAEVTAALLDGSLILGAQLDEGLLDGAGTFTIFPAALADGGAVPAFDGKDELAVVFPFAFEAELVDSAAGPGFRTAPGNFFFALPIGGAGGLLPLENTVFTGVIQDTVAQDGLLAGTALVDGSFSGTIKASEFATQLEALGAAFAGQSPQLLGFLDDNENGRLDAIFDPAAGVFVENELSLIFDIEADNDGKPEDPDGIIGDLFQLDTDGDGVKDSMGIGLGLRAVSAQIPQ